MDRNGKPYKSGEMMDRLSRFYRAKKDGDLPMAISPPVEITVRREDEGTSIYIAPQEDFGKNTCEGCRSRWDTDWILEISMQPQSNTDTIPALVNALQPTSRTVEATDHPFLLEAGTSTDGSDAPARKLDPAITERGSGEQTSQRTGDVEGANRDRGRSRTVHVCFR
jgi:hypothetical protein